VADTVPIVGAGRTGLALAAVLARFGVPSPIRGSWSKLVNTDVCLGEQERGTYQG
jgi:2-polyprenyl-6-methoxyphenol hydroxylase-like FAD-dependent oxidoreductase